MSRHSPLMLVIALSLLFVAYPCRGVHEVRQGKGSLAQTFLHSPGKQNHTSLRSVFTPPTVSVQGSDALDLFYRVAHQTPGDHNAEYYGLLAMTDVYGHELKLGQWTATAILLSHDGDGSISNYNSIHVGWQVFPARYGDSRTHFYTYWTRDGSQKTGCFNMDCPGFVRADGATIAPGAVVDPVSDANNLQNVTLKVFKDKASGDWWISYGYNSIPKTVGYYPKTLFTSMEDKANNIAFGAFAAAHVTLPTPPMGSGALPNGGQSRAASFSYVSLVDRDGKSIPVTGDWPSQADKGQCYSITPLASAKCFYGGPGGCK